MRVYLWRKVICLLVAFGGAGVCSLVPAQHAPHQHGATRAADGEFNPFVAADRHGRFYLVYVQRRDGKSDVMLRSSPDGVNFSAPVRVNETPGDATVRNENPPKLALSAKGELYVVWASERGRWKGDVRFARSTDGGRTFSRATTLNSDAAGEPAGHAFQSVAVDGRGRVYIAWIDQRHKPEATRGAEIWLTTSDDGGRTFTSDRRVLSDVCECCRTSLQVDPAGRLFLAYRTVPAAGPMHRDIVVAKSEDRGQTFTPVIVSRDAWEIDACPIAGPALAVDRTGQITAIWYTGGGSRPGLYYATSRDEGRTYGERRPLDAEQGRARHAQAVTLADNRLLVAWDDYHAEGKVFWGILDPAHGLRRKELAAPGASYPVVAAAGPKGLIAALNGSTSKIVTSLAEGMP